MNDIVYLDHNATTAPAPEVVDEMLDALQRAWANPSSTHEPGQTARRLLADARTRIASFLGCQGAELVFTSGATEANHQAILGALALARAESAGARRRLLVSAVEHPGLLALADRLAGEGVPVERIAVDAHGRLDLADLDRRLAQGDVALVSVMGANNETGVVMPVEAVAARVRAAGARLHVDATQLAGKARLHFGRSGADLMSVSAHKLHGPKGIGALLVRKGLALPALLAGRQERHRRGGTENLPGIAGFAAACDLAARTLDEDLARMTRLRKALEDGLRAVLPPGLAVLGEGAERLPNTLCVRFHEIDSERVLGRLERAGIVAASGAACTASGTQPSHVLLAMGCSAAQARAGVRFSLGRDTTPAQIRRTVEAAARVVHPLMLEDSPALAQAA
ncbi:cysteine desulfurase family protein [Sphaerotilus uruguayifluvii]|uniref:Cysteine desulfurase n=1 Tax=Sphaerotilus uruguayifluvii TaxID=2735897 RepID=A0ABX2G8N4_9BURK|nr:cysteine desulfurase family protein [Leptothrix sp. C29]NRT58405.1 cysteine desulfurase [Leptothrix sp. C29]